MSNDLRALISSDERVRKIVLESSLGHTEAAEAVNSLGYSTTEASVRRSRKSQTKTVAVIGDYQIGCHDKAFIEKQCEVIRDIKPDIIISTGDELDATSLGRWTRGMPEEFETTLQDELDQWYEVAEMINEAAPQAEKRMCRSNHTDRLAVSLRSRLPGLRDLRALELPNLMRLSDFGWIYDNPPGSATEFLPGVTYSHGDEWSITSKGQANKAGEMIKERGTHVVFGHSHQAGIYTQALGYNFNMRVKWALNVGTGMAFDRADYIKKGSPNWSRGVGIIYYDGTDAFPDLRLEINGKIRYDGRTYK